MTLIRRPAVAGSFYPADPRELEAAVKMYLEWATPSGPAPKAMILPHAGYVYSGAVAASGYARIASVRAVIKRVVLLGPSHFVAFDGLAASSADWFTTPLGMIRVDKDTVAEVLRLPHVQILDAAHAAEHSLEVHLPFLQAVLKDFSLVPLAVGNASAEEIAAVLDVLWDGIETLIVVSSDLSHFHDYPTARTIDFATSLAIEDLDPERISGDHACGCLPIRGLLRAAHVHGLHAVTLDLRNSGDTAGPRDEVVGYGAFALA